MKKYYILGGLALVLFLLGLHFVVTGGGSEAPAESTEQTSGGYGGLGK